MANILNFLTSIKMFGERQNSMLISFLIVQSLLLPTNAIPAKSGSNSRSLAFHDNVPDEGHINNRLNSEENAIIPKDPFKITVYPWNNHLGRPATMEWSSEEKTSRTCKEIPTRWQGKVRSVHTYDNCIVLYSLHNCDGASKVVKIGSPSHNRLSDICFQRKPISARPCTKQEIEAPITDQV